MPTPFTSLYLLTLSKEVWINHSEVFWQQAWPYSAKFYDSILLYSNCSSLVLTVDTLLLCLICKLYQRCVSIGGDIISLGEPGTGTETFLWEWGRIVTGLSDALLEIKSHSH